ncbi:MAG: NADH:flavin oxidoreductase [Marinifilaceae bacterium]|jgi:2,4-dienoyl-CoA reductase-like NADH-dependent reductase (Old Yellow Enzyme family)|nr:NADH:flavin oxidoreductase [Marinifilaceae bacterium]
MSLLEKTKVGNLELNNRIIRSALWMCMADKEGRLTPQLYKVYEELLQGGIGLILTGYAMVDQYDRPNPGMMGIYDDSFIEEHRKLVDIAHANHTPIVLQIAMGGVQSFHPDLDSHRQWGPSSFTNKVTGKTAREMSKEDISKMIGLFTEAAKRAKKSGYDGVELHGAHGYLLSQFLTPACNQRTDEYGGSLENRARVFIELIQSIKSELGAEFPVFVKMNHDDYMDKGEGLVVEDAIQVAKLLEGSGVDMIEISGVNETSGKGIGPARTKINKPELQSYYLEPTKQIADAVDIPVILMGGNRDFKRLEDIATNTKIKFFSIARPLLAEPDLINKWKKNPEYKPLCVSCNGCYREGEVGCVLRERACNRSIDNK